MTNETINVDPNEIAKFSQIADKWWDKTGEFKPLHDINPLRLDYIDQHAHLAGKTVLDVGCGGGILSESMARRGAASVLGVDMAELSLQTAQAHADAGRVANVAYRCVSVEDLAAEMPQAFDVVTCMEMLEHVPDPASIIRACAKLAKADGWVFFSTINGAGRGICAQPCAQRHARLAKIHHARRISAHGAAGRAGCGGHARDVVQPAHAAVFFAG